MLWDARGQGYFWDGLEHMKSTYKTFENMQKELLEEQAMLEALQSTWDLPSKRQSKPKSKAKKSIHKPMEQPKQKIMVDVHDLLKIEKSMALVGLAVVKEALGMMDQRGHVKRKKSSKDPKGKIQIVAQTASRATLNK